MTQNLGAKQVASNQDQKEQTINDAVGRLDAALTDKFTAAITVSNTFTLSAAQFQAAAQIDATGSGVTAGFDLIVPAIRRGLFVVSNEAGFTATVKILGQSPTPPTLATGGIALFFCDGASVRAV